MPQQTAPAPSSIQVPPPDLPPDIEVDHDLLERLHAGDQAAATAIYMRYAERLLSVARRHAPRDLQARFDPEDVVQSVFRTFFRRAAKGAYSVPEGDELWKLFLVIALNKVRNLGTHHRSTKRDIRKTTMLAGAAADNQDPLAAESLHMLELTIDEMLERSPDHAREMVLMRIQGHNLAEIAARTSRSKRTVERVLQHFRELLAQELSGADSTSHEVGHDGV